MEAAPAAIRVALATSLPLLQDALEALLEREGDLISSTSRATASG